MKYTREQILEEIVRRKKQEEELNKKELKQMSDDELNKALNDYYQ